MVGVAAKGDRHLFRSRLREKVPVPFSGLWLPPSGRKDQWCVASAFRRKITLKFLARRSLPRRSASPSC
jgi:hypothetical protein